MNVQTTASYEVQALGTAWGGFTAAQSFNIVSPLGGEYSPSVLRQMVEHMWGDVQEVLAFNAWRVETKAWTEWIGTKELNATVILREQVVSWSDEDQQTWDDIMFAELEPEMEEVC